MAKLKEQEFQQLTKRLPKREREKITRQMMTEDWLNQEIANAKQEMKNDLTLGIPWVVIYTISLIQFGLTAATIAIFCLGAVYFVYVTVKRGNYGLLKRKVQVYGEMLELVRS